MTSSGRYARGRGIALGVAFVTLLLVGVTVGVPAVGAVATVDGGMTAVDERIDTVDERIDTVDERIDTVDGDAVSEPTSLDRSHAVEPGTATSLDADDDTILIRHELSTNEESGTVDVTTEVAFPDRVTAVRLTPLSASGDRIEADGFERETIDDGDEEWVWDGETTRPSVSYTMDGNVTEEPDGPLAGDGAHRFVDAGDWALVRTPRASLGWSYRSGSGGGMSVERETAVAGEGVASQAVAFLGPYEEHAHEVAGQRFRLVVPDAAEPEATPEEVFEAFEGASTALRVGARDDEVFAVAAPTGSVSWAVRGLQIGDSDLWVRDVEPAGTAADVWTHEYVHTRQAYRAEPSARWFTEATATYYAALFALERGVADFEAFERTLSAGQRDPYAASTLSEPDTWSADADYVKGALVAGEIDRRIRVETDGRASLATAFRELNDAPETVTNDDVLDAVEVAVAEGGGDAVAAAVRDDAERLTTTDETPDFWDEETHAEAFGEPPARVGYGLDADGVQVIGEYRNRSLDRDPVELVEGETLEFATRVSNTGGTAGAYEVSMRVDGSEVTTRSGSVEAGEELIERLDHEFTDVGEHEVRIGGETLTVVVSEPASVSVRNVTVDADPVVAGGSVAVTATVGNDDGIPAEGRVEFRVNGEPVASDPVGLDAGMETAVERDVALEATGNATVTVVGPDDEASVTVSVEAADDDGLEGDDGGESSGEPVVSVPGFGPVVALVALFCIIGLLVRRPTP